MTTRGASALCHGIDWGLDVMVRVRRDRQVLPDCNLIRGDDDAGQTGFDSYLLLSVRSHARARGRECAAQVWRRRLKVNCNY